MDLEIYMKKTMRSVLLLGSGAIKIGEAGEFDYSGTQAIKALKELGIRVILVNPNIATIQTSEGLADEVYFLPVTPFFVTEVIKNERPDGILLSFGGQTALNCGIALHEQGVLKKYAVDVLGTPIDTIIATEDRTLFTERLHAIGIFGAKGMTVKSVEEGVSYARQLGFPVMLRSGFALGGTGSGVISSEEELRTFLTRAFATASQVILEECLDGWKELEYEVVRDADDNCIVVCTMENMDPVGIHTGESIVVAPAQTLTNEEYFSLRQKAIDVIRSLNIIGECNIQFALHPTEGTCKIIEVNARLSRSSALASKATGYPLAYVAAKLALGKTLPLLVNTVTGVTSAFFEPSLDYIVVKMPRWDLDKYHNVSTIIGSEMKSVGEVMSIGRTFEEAIQKAVRMLNDGYTGVIDARFTHESKETVMKKLKHPDSMRLFTIVSALYKGVSGERIHKITHIDRWYLEKLRVIVHVFKTMEQTPVLSKKLMKEAKAYGFSDRQIADIYRKKEEWVRNKRISYGITPWVKRIDTMAGEFPARTNYLYMTYNASVHDHRADKKEKRAVIIGCGPYSIGTSVEFDWCAVNCATALRKEGIKAVMVNSNPETVSTDFDMSDYLYFEELTLERILDIDAIEQCPCIVSVGGQIPNNLALPLKAHHVPIMGTDPTYIHRVESRQIFSALLDTLHIPQPSWGETTTVRQAIKFAEKIGYPILLRPSFVLSGKGMQVVYSREELEQYFRMIPVDIKNYPLLMTKFLTHATECDLDGVAQKGVIVISALSEHVEHGGQHSGDSTMIFPTPTLSSDIQEKIQQAARRMVKALHVTGPFNIQYLVLTDGTFVVIECNLRASRSMPFISKALGMNFMTLSIQCMTQRSVSVQKKYLLPYFVVKVPQFSFHKLRGADPVGSVEMNSTGEVAAFGDTPYEAYMKAILAVGMSYPSQKTVFVSIGGAEAKMRLAHRLEQLYHNGFRFYATIGTKIFLHDISIEATAVGKVYQGIHPNGTDLLKAHAVDFVLIIPNHTSKGKDDAIQTDGYTLRRLAVDMGIPIFTNGETANWFITAIHKYTQETLTVKPWSYYQHTLSLSKGGEL